MEDETISQCKIVLVGESGVGKSCIISRYINNCINDMEITTMGASYVCKNMTFEEYSGKSLKFEIWDTAGQEKYRAVTRLFYKDSAIAILVYDVTRKNSFEEMKSYWYEQIKEYAPMGINWNIVFGIAANKSDLADKEQVSESEAREFAQKINAIFRPTSAFSGGGIDDLFRCLGCKYLDPNFVDEEKRVTRDVNRRNSMKIKKKEGNEFKKCCVHG